MRPFILPPRKCDVLRTNALLLWAMHLMIGLSTVNGEVPREAVEAANSAGFKLFAQAFPEGANGSLAPLSVTSALAMLHPGTAGESRRELTQFLAGTQPAEIVQAYPQLFEALGVPAAEDSVPVVRASFASSLWVQQGFPIAAPFQQQLAERWGQQLHPLDFADDLEMSRQAISAWYAAQDPLLNDVTAGGVSNQTKLFLATAASLQAPWFARFDSTEPGTFQITAERSVPCQYLSLTLPVGYWEQPGLKGVRIPFRNERFGVVLLVPESTEARGEVERSLAAGAWPCEPSRFVRQPTALRIAKFQHRFAGKDLRAPLQACGVQAIFTRDADLSGIGPILTLDTLQYSNEFTLDENGCRASAAVGLSVVIKAQSVPFVTDRPFYYFVVDELTELVLFIGRVHDPSEDPNWSAATRSL